MKALTLHGIHAWCVMFGGKDIENRSWTPSDKLIGQRIAIHAGQKTGGSTDQIRDAYPDVPKQFPRGVILGTVRLKGYVDQDQETVVGLTKAEVRRAERSEWAGGPCLWVLEDPRPFTNPVPCSGKLGLWNAPDLDEASKSCP
jgi:hypothetical protein